MPRTTIALAAAALLAAPGAHAQQPPLDPNPCLGPQAAELRCPDLQMSPPYGLYLDKFTKRRQVLLRAGNSINSIGAGPAELHGVRDGRRTMRARQRIYRRAGGRIGVRTGARLIYKFIPRQTGYWKFWHAARFELWRLDRSGQRTELVRVGPKIAYCLRDLGHPHPRLRRSPRRIVYPSCNTDPRRRRVTLGTSVGWADVYPPTYHEQWLDVTGLRGCFAYVHIADPRNGIYESNEDNNAGQVIVRLPFRKPQRRRCPGQRRAPAEEPAPSDPY